MTTTETGHRYSPFVNAYSQYMEAGAEGFGFEEDFVESSIRCIPMVVRFKLDIAGIKLKLSEWSRFTTADRLQLMQKFCMTDTQIASYRRYLQTLIKIRTGDVATNLTIELNPAWTVYDTVPSELNEKAAELNLHISEQQWKQLSNLQRFTLLKLCRPGHENRNFPAAIKEFGLIKIPV
jgi:hypothetical protein